MPDPIRVYIGTEPKTEIFRRVLEHSIRKRTSADVRFTTMIGPEWEYPIDGIKVGTGFSLRRWMIPAYCGWKGRAIYLDADQIVLSDIAGLWHLGDRTREQHPPFPVLWATIQTDKWSPKKPVPQTSVMLIDCEQAKGWPGFDIDFLLEDLQRTPTKEHYGFMMHAQWLPQNLIAPVAAKWNHLNKYVAGQTRLLHYTSEPQQPHTTPDHPLAHLFQAELEDAIKAGVIPKGEFEEALDKFGVKEDWRPKNGIHPWYRRYLPLFPK